MARSEQLNPPFQFFLPDPVSISQNSLSSMYYITNMKMCLNVLFTSLLLGIAYPCSCQELPPPEEAYEMSNVVFSGQVTNVIEDWNNGFMEISIDVHNVWKGIIDNQIIILTGLDDCGYYFQINEEYLIYGYYSQLNYIWTDICTRTNLLEYASEDLEYLNGLNSNPIYGYLRESTVSDCQDECSQYYIEPEIDGGFGTVPIIFQNSNINLDLYMNRFVEVDLGQEVTCVECNAFEIQEINLSDNCQYISDCFQDPCIEAEECEINTPVECIPHFCGGCYADFYDLEGNLVDCYASSNECIDLSGLDFGACAMVLGIGYVNGECSYVSGCGWILNDIDYSNAFFDSMDECSSACFEISFTLGDINYDSLINVQDIVLLVSFVLQTDFPTDTEFMAADYNGDGILNILDVVSIVDLILSPQVSIQINSGTSYGECWGYCVFELQLDNSNALFTASGWGWYEFPDLLLEDNLSQEMWQQIIELIDFEYFQSLDDVYGCPDCADGGAEFIEIIYDGVAKQVTFDAYTEIDGIQELTILLRDLRAEYWNQINENQECSIMPEVGPCDGICPTYYFNQNTNQCEEFITGCCGIEAFDTMQGCMDACE